MIGTSTVSAMTGMPSGLKPKVRRGGGRHKVATNNGPNTQAKPNTAAHHKASLDAAMKNGSADAHSHALNLAKALLQGKKASANLGPKTSATSMGLASGSQPTPNPTDGY